MLKNKVLPHEFAFKFAIILKRISFQTVFWRLQDLQSNEIEPQRTWYEDTRIIQVYKIHWLDKNIRKFVVLDLGVTKRLT